MKKVILNKIPGNEDRIHVIHNWADKNRVYPVAKEKNPLIDNFRLRDKKVVMYSGNLGRYQPLEVMINAAVHTPVNDSKTLALNILSLLDDPKKAQKMGKNGRKYFLNNFERKKITMQWKEVLESICQQQSFSQEKNFKAGKIPVASIYPNGYEVR